MKAPQTAKAGAPEELHHSEEDEPEGDRLPHACGGQRRAVLVATASPENRPQDPAAPAERR